MQRSLHISVQNFMRLAICLCLLFVDCSRSVIHAQKAPSLTEADRFITLQETDPALNSDPILAKVRIKLDTFHHSLDLDTSTSPYSVVLGEQDPLSIPVEAVIRLRFLTRDLKKASLLNPAVQEALDQTRTAIYSCAENGIASRASVTEAAKSSQCSAVEASFAHLSDVIIGQAHNKGLTVTRSKGVTSGYRIDFKFVPRRYPIKMMTALEEKKCEMLHESKNQYFTSILSDYEFLLGRYYYELDWPKELGGVETGFIVADTAKTLTFTANGK